MAETLGKKAEDKIRGWLDRPQDGYSFDRIPDQMTGNYYVSRNICDFTCYKYPYMYHIESKCTEHDRFDFSQLSDTQRDGLRIKSEIQGNYGLVIVCFATYKRSFIFNIKDIAEFITPTLSLNDQQIILKKSETVATQLVVKSVNIKTMHKWNIPYVEIPTIPSRKLLLDYTGELPDLVSNLKYV